MKLGMVLQINFLRSSTSPSFDIATNRKSAKKYENENFILILLTASKKLDPAKLCPDCIPHMRTSVTILYLY